MGQKVTIDDVRKAGYCVRGVRSWASQRGLNFADFLSDGIDEDTLAGMDDPLARRVLEYRRGR